MTVASLWVSKTNRSPSVTFFADRNPDSGSLSDTPQHAASRYSLCQSESRRYNVHETGGEEPVLQRACSVFSSLPIGEASQDTAPEAMLSLGTPNAVAIRRIVAFVGRRPPLMI